MVGGGRRGHPSAVPAPGCRVAWAPDRRGARARRLPLGWPSPFCHGPIAAVRVGFRRATALVHSDAWAVDHRIVNGFVRARWPWLRSCRVRGSRLRPARQPSWVGRDGAGRGSLCVAGLGGAETVRSVGHVDASLSRSGAETRRHLVPELAARNTGQARSWARLGPHVHLDTPRRCSHRRRVFGRADAAGARFRGGTESSARDGAPSAPRARRDDAAAAAQTEVGSRGVRLVAMAPRSSRRACRSTPSGDGHRSRPRG
jgi:hypothetical protein